MCLLVNMCGRTLNNALLFNNVFENKKTHVYNCIRHCNGIFIPASL